MQETPISFKSDGLAIDGRLALADTNRAVVITHPHPLYGGDMQNPVVQSIKTACQRKGYATLRFNFRGVGRSEGRYDEGRGEINDLRAAVNLLRKKGIDRIDLAGYSFGTWINAGIAKEFPMQTMVMVAPPVAMLKFEKDHPLPGLKLVITGSEDEFAPPRLVQPMIRHWNPDARFQTIDGADHFFFGYLDELEKILFEHIN